MARAGTLPGAGRAKDFISGIPGYGRLKEAGGMGELYLKSLGATVTPPYNWFGVMASEMALAFRRTWFPAFFGMVLIATGGAIGWFSPLVMSLGAMDRVSTGASRAWITEEADWIPLMALAGVAGAAMTADLGARKIREEIAALRVLGTDPIKELVVPRVVALMLIAPVLGVVGLIGTDFGMYFFWPAYSGNNISIEGYIESMVIARHPMDLLWLVIKCAVTGVMIGVVACYKGLNVGGGSEGVGRAVNETVLITIVGLLVINNVGNTAFYGLLPEISLLKG